MTPLEFLSFAGRVATLGSAGARSAVSRAYYGAFHFARETLGELEVKVARNGTSHAILPQYLQSTNSTTAKDAAILLSHLHYSRNKCDYDLDDTALDQFSSAQLRSSRPMRSFACLPNIDGSVSTMKPCAETCSKPWRKLMQSGKCESDFAISRPGASFSGNGRPHRP